MGGRLDWFGLVAMYLGFLLLLGLLFGKHCSQKISCFLVVEFVDLVVAYAGNVEDHDHLATGCACRGRKKLKEA